MADVTKSGWTRGNRLMMMTIIFRDGDITEYWVKHDSITNYNYNMDIQQFIFTEYKSVDHGDEFGGMFHSGGAFKARHCIPLDTIKDVSYSADYLFGGDSILYEWNAPSNSTEFVVAAESWVENIV